MPRQRGAGSSQRDSVQLGRTRTSGHGVHRNVINIDVVEHIGKAEEGQKATSAVVASQRHLKTFPRREVRNLDVCQGIEGTEVAGVGHYTYGDMSVVGRGLIAPELQLQRIEVGIENRHGGPTVVARGCGGSVVVEIEGVVATMLIGAAGIRIGRSGTFAVTAPAVVDFLGGSGTGGILETVAIGQRGNERAKGGKGGGDGIAVVAATVQREGEVVFGVGGKPSNHGGVASSCHRGAAPAYSGGVCEGVACGATSSNPCKSGGGIAGGHLQILRGHAVGQRLYRHIVDGKVVGGAYIVENGHETACAGIASEGDTIVIAVGASGKGKGGHLLKGAFIVGIGHNADFDDAAVGGGGGATTSIESELQLLQTVGKER